MRLAHCILLAGFISAPLYAHPLNGFSFAHKDWEVACDNTGTCRAAGYSDHAVSVLLTRAAGPDTSVYVDVAFAQRTANQPSQKDATLFIDGQKQGALTFSAEGYFKLNYQQRKVFLDALRQDNTIEFAANGERLPLSNAGSSAVLLKMDEFQKRINTQSAVLHPGDKNSNDVLNTEPAPLIITHPVIRTPDVEPLTTAQQQKIEPKIRVTPEMNCHELEEGQERIYYRIPVDKQHVLIQTECFDSSRTILWLTNTELTASPKLITSDASEYENGEIARFSDPIQLWVWEGNNFTLRDEYRSGGQGNLSIGGVWTLPTFVSIVRSQSNVDTDNTALKTLHSAVESMQKSDPGLELSKIASQFPLTGQITDFRISYAEDSTEPTAKPSPEISDDEWLAFSRTTFSVDSENGGVNFTLIDLDDDGKRDLIINSYVGGTGLFSYTGVLKRGDNAFVVVNGKQDDDDFGVPGALFSENGRGANQWSQWVRINGKVYALWYNGLYNEEKLYLLRPFSPDEKAPVVTVHYRYEYDMNSIEPREEGQPLLPKLNTKDKTKLITELNKMQSMLVHNQQASDGVSPICPIPARYVAGRRGQLQFRDCRELYV
ncbi:DUF1176 domain-containing protein [Citrobacter sp. 210820-DFI.7.8]|nr:MULTISPECIES: DUF1176 domain-containing protein [Citrobacter]MCB6780347.1 DUF1176 domain-containing protein [Citrobacter sp. 210820-DFI.7.8]MCB6790077.1 DUF1176 domain-containing protein [Citrobacter sp. 210820-DFI.7.7]MCB8604545.1 DUF1176 domain-containing protein [Citrobacter europaeus]MCQ5007949.1 DUF1176 domain-containing protein [Citrobacter europaeus]